MSRNEALDIPAALRQEAYERDSLTCRFCGRWLGERAGLHHIHYGGDYTGMGGRRLHELDNVLTICWLAFGRRACHDIVHANKGLWVPVLEVVVTTPGVTALAVRRWNAASGARTRPGRTS